MANKYIKATFIGAKVDKLPYENGMEYYLAVWSSPKFPVVIRLQFRGGYSAVCPYASVEAFLNNWDQIVTQ